MRLRMMTQVTVLLGMAVGPAAGLTPTPTPPPTNTVTCGATATPYCADHCEPCPTVRAGCYAGSCGECHENPTCGEGEICEPGGSGGCCTCVPIGGSPTPSPTPVRSPVASPTPPLCFGDCNSDGAIGIDELITAVNAALGGGPAQSCIGADRDGNGVVGIDELIALVLSALEGCPASLPFEDGAVYDVDGTETIAGGSSTRFGLAVVRREGDGVRIDIAFDVLETLALSAAPDGDILFLGGSGVVGGDVVVSATGTARFTRSDGTLRFAAVIDVDSFLSPRRLVLTIERPVSGTSEALGGDYRLRLRHDGAGGPPYDSHIDLSVTVPASGFATCSGASDVSEDDGTLLAELGETECHVSPRGRFAYSTSYSGADVPLQLSGNLRAGGGQNVGGTFWLAAFPSVRDHGSWDVVSSPP